MPRPITSPTINLDVEWTKCPQCETETCEQAEASVYNDERGLLFCCAGCEADFLAPKTVAELAKQKYGLREDGGRI